MKTRTIVSALMLAAALAGGCSKEVTVTIRNHSPVDRTLQLTEPAGTRQIGAVAPKSSFTHTIKIKKDLLPAPCQYAAGTGASVSFEVTDESPELWFFHITGDGRMVGPLREHDVHVEEEKRGEIRKTVERRMIVE